MANLTRRVGGPLGFFLFWYFGFVFPYPFLFLPPPENPFFFRYLLPPYAPFFFNLIFYFGGPVFSVWPSIRILVSGYFTKTFATFVRFTLASSLKMLELILKSKPELKVISIPSPTLDTWASGTACLISSACLSI